ncbi:Hypothetical predicted protein [Octopus vulgaris]|uniref:Uncharacterized protein n=1 Tax=Octopus vulgaris TaxID=6645 RepID=A0AA36EUP3_OCTVU|nr:Hypothetical predicted protein [Octopus vulgaris]
MRWKICLGKIPTDVKKIHDGRYDRMMALSKEERIPDRMMDLSKEERIELVLLSEREGWSYRKIAEEFNLRHPYRFLM